MSAIENKSFEHIMITKDIINRVYVDTFLVYSKKHGTLLGQIRNWDFWQEHCFIPHANRVISLGHMKDICSFVEELVQERKKK